MKQYIVSLPHHPKRVIIISLVIALVIGFFGYKQINKKQNVSVPLTSADASTQSDSGTQNLTLGFLASGRIENVSVKAGDAVTKGQVLATLDAESVVGALDQAKAAYATAEANYQKVINGATGSTIDVAKAAVNTAQVNLNQVTNQQNTLVANALRNLYSDDLVAQPDNNSFTIAPVISGNYNGTAAGDYDISFKNADFSQISYSGLETGTTIPYSIFNTVPVPLGTEGLLISFPNGTTGLSSAFTWTVHIPNKSGSDYTANLNAYQSAVSTQTQAIAGAQAALDQANATLASVVTTARPEDVATAQAEVDNAAGAVQVAEAAYENTIITAPSDGTVVSVSIAPGQIATPNAPAILFTSNISTN